MNKEIIVGIDVGKYEVAVCVQAHGQRHEQVFKEMQTETGQSALVSWLKQWSQGGLVCMEATGRYSHHLADQLVDAGWGVSVVNPYRVKAYADSRIQRTKTDKVDARMIAEFAQSQPLHDWQVPDPAWLELQAMTRQLIELKRKKQRCHNQFQAQPPSAVVQAQYQAEIRFWETQISEIKKALQAHVRQNAELKERVRLVESIKGIGEQTAWVIVGEVVDWTAFADVRDVVAYAGLDPTHHQSGTVAQAGGISKFGNARLRAALYWPAISARRCNPQIKAHSQRMAERGKTKKEQIVAAMRKLLHQVYGVLKSGQVYDPTYGLNLEIAA